MVLVLGLCPWTTSRLKIKEITKIAQKLSHENQSPNAPKKLSQLTKAKAQEIPKTAHIYIVPKVKVKYEKDSKSYSDWRV